MSQVAFSQNGVAFLGTSAIVGSAIEKKETRTIDKSPAISYAPFDLEGGMILVEARINGESANFVLDTGAPGLVINSSDFLEVETTTVDGIQGKATVGAVKVDDFRWAGVEHQQVDAQLMDMSCFEKMTGKAIKGLIGHAFLQGKELYIDYQRKLIRLVKTEKMPANFRKAEETVAFKYLEHLPIVKMKVNGKLGYFGLDTGSEVNIIHSRWQKKLKITATDKGELVGVDGANKEVESIWIKSSTVGNKPLEEMSFFMVDLTTIEKEYGMRLDGILGFPFFSTNEVALNFADQKLSFCK